MNDESDEIQQPATPGTQHRRKTIQDFELTIDQIFEPHLRYTAACSSHVVSVGQSIDEVATLLLGNQIKKLIDSIRQHLTREQVLGHLCTLPRSDAATDADINLLNIQTEQLLKLTQLPTSSALRQKLQTAFKKVEEIPYALIGELTAKMSADEWIDCYEKAFVKKKK